MKFRKKPVTIEAVRWSGENTPEIMEFFRFGGQSYYVEDGLIFIPTLEGTMAGQPGDMIVRGVQGEVYPVKPAIFVQTYEPEE